MVRNSVGANCYVADEIITSRAGVRHRMMIKRNIVEAKPSLGWGPGRLLKWYKVTAKASLGETQGGQHRRRGQDGHGGRALQVWLMNTLSKNRESYKMTTLNETMFSGQRSLPLLTLILSSLLWPPWQAMQFSRLVELLEMCSSWKMFYFYFRLASTRPSWIMDQHALQALPWRLVY